MVFLHWFAGRRRTASIGDVLRVKAAARGIRVEPREFDLTRPAHDGGGDVFAYADAHLESARRGEVDIFHAGFPCSSFSRARFNRPGVLGPPPVRSRAHPRGLPGNTPAQQREAELGDKLADASLLMARAVQASARLRGVPAAATPENPDDPGG